MLLGLKQGVLQVPYQHRSLLLRALAHKAPQLLHLQSFLRLNQTSSFLSASTTTTMSAPSPDIPRIISFWFDDAGPQPAKKWFQGGAALDSQIEANFGPLVAEARTTTALDAWTSTPAGTLALLLLLDQFPRNIHRGSPLSYAADAKAQRIATAAVATGADRALPLIQQPFVYLPLMHAESMLGQVACVALYEGLAQRAKEAEGLSDGEREFLVGALPFAQRHLAAIVRFGRFCGRNHVLGRDSTAEELELLRENPTGF